MEEETRSVNVSLRALLFSTVFFEEVYESVKDGRVMEKIG